MPKLIIEGTPEEIADTISALGTVEIEAEFDFDEDDCCGCCDAPNPKCTSDPKRGELHFTGLDRMQRAYIFDAFKTVMDITRF